MEFKKFKPAIHRTDLYCFIFAIVCAMIGVVAVATDAVSSGSWSGPSGHEAVGRIIYIVIDAIVMALIVWLFHLSEVLVSGAYVMQTSTITTKDKIYKRTSFKNPWWIHVGIVAFVIVVYFATISAMYQTYTQTDPSWNVHPWNQGWVGSLDRNWWICLIIAALNLLTLEFAILYNDYQFNHDRAILNQIKD